MDIINILKKTDALLDGHFVLSSGLHSGQYMQCASVLKHPKYAQKLCKELAKKVSKKKIDVVVAPAMGGVLVGYELARALGTRSLFTERKDGKVQLRRNFQVAKGERVLIAEDVITTGKSTKEVVEVMNSLGGNVVAVACFVNRSGIKNILPKTPIRSLVKIDIKTYTASACPLCKKGNKAYKPGSRV